MPKHTFFRILFLILILLFPRAPLMEGAGRPKADTFRLKRSYDANEWHMKRFMAEFVALERESAADPKSADLRKRLATLKIQIDLLSRENELILDYLDTVEK